MPNTRTYHRTLVANAVTSVTLDGNYNTVAVLNRGGEGEVYFLVDPGSTTPAVAGDGTEVVPGIAGAWACAPAGTEATVDPTVVKLISSANTRVTVKGV